jgi:hypothetical protein
VAALPQHVFQELQANPALDISGSLIGLTQIEIPAELITGSAQFAAPPSAEPLVILATASTAIEATAILTIL